jgi:hypothetical protein
MKLLQKQLLDVETVTLVTGEVVELETFVRDGRRYQRVRPRYWHLLKFIATESGLAGVARAVSKALAGVGIALGFGGMLAIWIGIGLFWLGVVIIVFRLAYGIF